MIITQALTWDRIDCKKAVIQKADSYAILFSPERVINKSAVAILLTTLLPPSLQASGFDSFASLEFSTLASDTSPFIQQNCPLSTYAHTGDSIFN
jgi:hypothetical protein